MSNYRVTYCDYQTGVHIAADGPIAMSRQEILDLMAKVLTSSGSFVSVMDADDNMLQFVLDDDGMVMLDLPHPKKRGSYVKVTSVAACVTAIENLGDKVTIDDFDGLVFERW